jgi:hypothetical protein
MDSIAHEDSLNSVLAAPAEGIKWLVAPKLITA